MNVLEQKITAGKIQGYLEKFLETLNLRDQNISEQLAIINSEGTNPETISAFEAAEERRQVNLQIIDGTELMLENFKSALLSSSTELDAADCLDRLLVPRDHRGRRPHRQCLDEAVLGYYEWLGDALDQLCDFYEGHPESMIFVELVMILDDYIEMIVHVNNVFEDDELDPELERERDPWTSRIPMFNAA